MNEFFLLTLTLGGFVVVFYFVLYGLDLLYDLIYAVTKRRVPREIRENVRGRR